MKFINIIAAFSLILFIGCGGESSDQQQAESQETEMADEVRTIEIIGIDQMKYVVEESTDGISVGDSISSGDYILLSGITAEPGEEIKIRLTTESSLPPANMAHNWILLAMNADVQSFANAALQAKDNDYIPADMGDQIIAQTGLAGGGETVEVTFTAPEEPGDYPYICSFPAHFSAGMKGMLTVEGSSGNSM